MAIVLRKWIDRNLIKTQIWVSLNCAALALVALVRFQFFNFDFQIIPSFFFITFSGYHFFMLHPFENSKRFVTQYHFKFFVVGIFGLLLCFIFQSNIFHAEKILTLVILSILSVLYNLPFKGFSLRKIPYFKIFYIALMWSLWINFYVMEAFIWTAFWAIFFFVLSITIPFDIRDEDLEEKTVVQFLGIDKSVYVSVFLLWVSYFFWTAGYFNGILSMFFMIPFLFFSIILLGVNTFETKSKNDFYVNFVVETIPFILLIYFFSFYIFIQ